MPVICINAAPLANRITGIERYMYETIKRIDKLMPEYKNVDIRLLCPKGVKLNLPQLSNIQKVAIRSTKDKKLDIMTAKAYLNKVHGIYCSLSGSFCIQKNALICIHDVRFAILKTDSSTFRIKCAINFLSAKLFARLIVTDCNTTCKDMIDVLHTNPNIIKVIPLGWEHICEVQPDYSIFEKHKQIKNNEYYYALGSLAPHKNFKWIYENAKNNPDKLFVIAGKLWNDEGKDVPQLPNILYLGYVTDEVSKALMENCKAFLQPSKYEGFGIPPLEALACGASIAVANSSCLPEIFSTCATLFDPDDYHFNFNKIKLPDSGAKKLVLSYYSWNHTSKDWMDIFNSLK